MNYEIEDIEAIFEGENLVRVSPEKIRRVNIGGNRYYVSNGKLYPSVTTILSKGLPTSQFLIDWIASMGKERAEAYKNERASYGTLMHIVFSKFLLLGEIDLDTIGDFVCEYCKEERYEFNQAKWTNDIKKDLLSFAQFCFEYELKPIAIEFPFVVDEEWGHYAGCVDLLCELTIPEKGFWGETYKSGERKGQPKETFMGVKRICIIDYKSNRSGNFYDSAKFQLPMYSIGTEKAFGITPERLYNFSPKDWEEIPNYTLADQTGKVSEEQIKAVILLGSEKLTDKKRVVEMGGVLVLGSDAIQYVNSVSIDQILSERRG